MAFSDIVDNIRDSELVTEKKPVFIAIVLVLILFIAGLIVLLIQTNSSDDKNKNPNFVMDAPIVIPDTPNAEQQYYKYRVTPEKWNIDELEKWLTYPDDNIMKQLQKANDDIVEEIEGVVP